MKPRTISKRHQPTTIPQGSRRGTVRGQWPWIRTYVCSSAHLQWFSDPSQSVVKPGGTTEESRSAYAPFRPPSEAREISQRTTASSKVVGSSVDMATERLVDRSHQLIGEKMKRRSGCRDSLIPTQPPRSKPFRGSFHWKYCQAPIKANLWTWAEIRLAS